MEADPILFPGVAPLKKTKIEAFCHHCGNKVEKPQAQLKNAIRRGWRIFCGSLCQRAGQTKYLNFTSKERMSIHQRVTQSKSKCGTQAKYVAGCRCNVCREALAEYQRDYRKRKSAQCGG